MMGIFFMVQDQFLQNNWHVLAHSRDLQPGTVLQKRILGEDLVLWHNGDKILAWQDFCPHRGARLSLGWVDKDTLVCPYHGLAFNTEGKCVRVLKIVVINTWQCNIAKMIGLIHISIPDRVVDELQPCIK